MIDREYTTTARHMTGTHFARDEVPSILRELRAGHTVVIVVDNMRTMMERQVEHMVRLIDDLLDVSRITRGKITLQKKPTLVSELVEVAVEANRAGIEERGIELHVDVMAEAAHVDVAPTRMVQVLLVLCSARCRPPSSMRSRRRTRARVAATSC